MCRKLMWGCCLLGGEGGVAKVETAMKNAISTLHFRALQLEKARYPVDSRLKILVQFRSVDPKLHH